MVATAEGAALIGLVFLVVFAESAILLDLVVPGEVGLVLAGTAAEQNGTSLVLVIVAATLGATAGDSLGYVVGRRFGPALVTRWRWTRRLEPSLERARDHYARRGGVTVAVARWIGALRAVVPVVAGAAALTYRRFLAWSLPSAAAWSAVVASLGFAFGDDVVELVDRVGLGVSLVAVAVVVGAVWYARRRRQAGRGDESPHGDREPGSGR